MTSAIERAVAAVGPKPYYEHAGVTIYHGDCRDMRMSLCQGRRHHRKRPFFFESWAPCGLQ